MAPEMSDFAERRGERTGGKLLTTTAVTQMAMLLSTAPAAAVWSCNPASCVHSSIGNVLKRWVACCRDVIIVHSPSVFWRFVVLKLLP